MEHAPGGASTEHGQLRGDVVFEGAGVLRAIQGANQQGTKHQGSKRGRWLGFRRRRSYRSRRGRCPRFQVAGGGHAAVAARRGGFGVSGGACQVTLALDRDDRTEGHGTGAGRGTRRCGPVPLFITIPSQPRSLPFFPSLPSPPLSHCHRRLCARPVGRG
jgi:hypothetical protein